MLLGFIGGAVSASIAIGRDATFSPASKEVQDFVDEIQYKNSDLVVKIGEEMESLGYEVDYYTLAHTQEVLLVIIDGNKVKIPIGRGGPSTVEDVIEYVNGE